MTKPKQQLVNKPNLETILKAKVHQSICKVYNNGDKNTIKTN